MTLNQKFKFYFPAWNDCCQANSWRMEKKRLVIDESRITEEGRKVLTLARQRAQMANRPTAVDDMRHGAHILALGRDKSSEHLTNAEVDRVVTLFRLLQDPEDLDAVMKWQSYQRGEDPGEIKRLDYAIGHAAPDAYVRQICADRFGTRMWEDLEKSQKRQLAMTLKERNKSFRKPMQRGDAQPQHIGKLQYVKGPF
jgi:hypothetical protein